MEKKSRKKRIVISLIIMILTGGGALFGYYNHHVASSIQNQKQTFQMKIKAVAETMQKEDKESQIEAISEFRKVETEIDSFQQKVYFFEINSSSFKAEKELIIQKASEAREYVNFLYKVKLDASVKDPKTLSQDEAKAIVQDLDMLSKEIQADGILNSDVVQTFSDKVNELKELYTPLFAKSTTEVADVNAPVKSEEQSTTNVPLKSMITTITTTTTTTTITTGNSGTK